MCVHMQGKCVRVCICKQWVSELEVQEAIFVMIIPGPIPGSCIPAFTGTSMCLHTNLKCATYVCR